MDRRRWTALAAANGLLAVAAGAFAGHGLEAAGDAHAAGLVETGARYQMWHALALFAATMAPRPCLPAMRLWAAGAALFPLSLYALALGAPHAVGLATPVGGTALLAGWAALAWWALKGPA